MQAVRALIVTASLLVALAWGAMQLLAYLVGLGTTESISIAAIFGALGGVTSGVFNNKGRLILADFIFSEPLGIRAGFVGDILIGSGGAASALFLFSGTISLGEGPSKFVLLICVSFLAGAFGQRIIEIAGGGLVASAERAAERVAGETVGKLALPTAVALAEKARRCVAEGDDQTALEYAEKAIAADPKYNGGYTGKGSALKRLGRVPEALKALEEGLSKVPDHPILLYNRACYRALLGHSADSILTDLRKAIEQRSRLRKDAAQDTDLKSLRDDPAFKALLAADETKK